MDRVFTRPSETDNKPHLQACDVEHLYVTPPVGAEAEHDSFNFQSQSFNDSAPPEKLTQILQRMESLLEANRWSLPEDFLSREHIERTVERVGKTHDDKSSGAVFSRQQMPLVRDVYARYGVPGVADLVEERIAQLDAGSVDDAKYAAAPIRIFIKREAHKAAKAAQKRWRLIWGVDIIDRLVDELLYHEMLTTALRNCEAGPLKPGYTFKRGGVHRMTQKYGADHAKSWNSFDSKQHDMTTPGWALSCVRALNSRLCVTTGVKKTRWDDLSSRREMSVLYGRFVFSDGTVCRKIKPGIQPSGRLTTIDSNSKVVLLYRTAWDVQRGVLSDPSESVCMGDDTVLKNVGDVPAFLAYLKSLGVTWTIESETGAFVDQNFCSMKFRRLEGGYYVPVPLNWEKNVYAISHPERRAVDVSGDSLLSLCVEYAFAGDKFDTLHGLLARYYPGNFKSPEWCQAIVTGFEGAGLEGADEEWDILDHFLADKYPEQCSVGA